MERCGKYMKVWKPSSSYGDPIAIAGMAQQQNGKTKGWNQGHQPLVIPGMHILPSLRSSSPMVSWWLL